MIRVRDPVRDGPRGCGLERAEIGPCPRCPCAEPGRRLRPRRWPRSAGTRAAAASNHAADASEGGRRAPSGRGRRWRGGWRTLAPSGVRRRRVLRGAAVAGAGQLHAGKGRHAGWKMTPRITPWSARWRRRVAVGRRNVTRVIAGWCDECRRCSNIVYCFLSIDFHAQIASQMSTVG